MPSNNFSDIKISGSVTVVPKVKRSIEEDIELYGGNYKQVERLKRTLGFNQRRIAPREVTALDLCESASQSLFKKLDLSPIDINGIIFITQTPDHSQPSNASLIHGRLGFSKQCAAFDVGLGCSGFVYGLWLAFSLIANGSSSKILLLAGDTLSRLVNPKDRSLAPLFGDAGSATLIEKEQGGRTSWFRLGSDGTGASDLIVPAGGSRNPISKKTEEEFTDNEGNVRSLQNLFMNGSEVFNFSIEVVPREIQELLKYAKCEKSEVDYFVLHQANRYMVQNIGKRLGCDLKRFPIASFGVFGNISSASIPGAMAFELGENFSTKAKKRLVLSGFGVGLSWGSCLVDLSEIRCLEYVEYNPINI